MGLKDPTMLLLENDIDGKIVLLSEVGSSAHGIVSESEDTDYTAVFVHTLSGLINGVNESQMLRTAKEGERSGPNDIDMNVYSLRRFARLAQNGNPSILTAIFSEKRYLDVMIDWDELTDLIRSKRVGYAFLGYMNEQLSRWQGRSSKRVNRPELVEAHGYDTKYASHVLRLGYQGLEYIENGSFKVPMSTEQSSYLSLVRAGTFKEAECLSTARQMQEILVNKIEKSDFPEKPQPIDEWLYREYISFMPLPNGQPL